MAEGQGRSNYINVAMGLVIMSAGVLLLLVTNGVLPLRQVVQLWPVGLVVVGVAVVVQSIRDGDAARVPFAALFWLVVLGLLFSYTFERRTLTPTETAQGQVNVFSVLGARRPSIDGPFHGGQFTFVMGGASLDLRHASVAPGETIVIDVFAVMGGGEIRVPSDWDVSIETSAFMGGVKDERGAPKTVTETPEGSFAGQETSTAETVPAPAPPHVIVRGTVFMGGLTLKS